MKFFALFLFSLLFLAACATGSSMMSMQSFHEIPLGTSLSEVVTSAGRPYAIHEKEDGAVEYEYIERMREGGRALQERHYYFLFKEGKVASKRVKEVAPPPFLFDSFDMQTTQSGPPGQS